MKKTSPKKPWISRKKPPATPLFEVILQVFGFCWRHMQFLTPLPQCDAFPEQRWNTSRKEMGDPGIHVQVSKKKQKSVIWRKNINIWKASTIHMQFFWKLSGLVKGYVFFQSAMWRFDLTTTLRIWFLVGLWRPRGAYTVTRHCILSTCFQCQTW